MSDHGCVLPHQDEPERVRGAIEGALVCLGHERQLRGYLTDLSRFASDVILATFAETMSVSTTGTFTSGTKERQMPIGDGRADHIGHIRAVLGEWVKLVAEERRTAVPDYADPHLTARFLGAHHMWIIEQPWIDEYHAELRDLTSTARVLLYPPKGSNRTQLPCPLVESEGCTGTLKSMDSPRDATRIDVVCDCCGYVLPPDQWRTYRRQLHRRLTQAGSGKVSLTKEPAVLVTAEDLKWWAMAEGIPDATLRSWLHRGELVGQGVGGRVLFDLDKAQALVGRRKREKEAAA